MRTIYAYTTATDRSRGKYKIGETKRTADSRIKEQESTGSSEPFEKVFESESTLSDHAVRNKLRLLGFNRVRLEWMGGFRSDNEVVAVLSKIIADSGNDTRIEYKPRFFQNLVKNNILKKYESELDSNESKIDFAVELAPRFGKTIWALDLIKTLFNEKDIKLCIIPTYILTSLSSFIKDFYKFKGFSDDMVLVDEHDNLSEVIEDYYDRKMIILPLSLHMREHEDKLDIIKNLPSKNKMTIIDEADFGAHRIGSQKKIDYIDAHLNIYMTGTAIERVSSPLINLRDNITRWSYFDMLMVKKGEHPSQVGLNDLENSISSVSGIVIPRFMRLSLGGVVDNFNSIPEEYRTDWSKLFSDVKKSKGILSDLIKSLFGVYNGKLTYLVDLNTDELSPKDVTMVFANTPNKKEQTNFFNLVKEVLGPQYIVSLFNSDESSNKKAEEEAMNLVAMAKKQGKKVVFISKDMASRSFSIPEIDTVILMFDRGSYSSVAQKVSRVLTPGNTYHNVPKVYGNIISLSLDPNRDEINPIDEYLVYEGEKVQVQELSDGINRVLRSVNIFVNGDGDLEPIILDEYANKLINSSSLIRIGMDSVKVDSIINDVDMVKLLLGVDINKTISNERIEGIDSSKVKRVIGEETEKESKNKVLVDNLRIKLKEVLSNIVQNVVEISEINNCESNDIIKTLDMIESKGYNDEVIFEVGVDTSVVKKLILNGSLSEKLLNTIITSYNNEENLISL